MRTLHDNERIVTATEGVHCSVLQEPTRERDQRFEKNYRESSEKNSN
jgi:hypothetical protein